MDEEASLLKNRVICVGRPRPSAILARAAEAPERQGKALKRPISGRRCNPECPPHARLDIAARFGYEQRTRIPHELGRPEKGAARAAPIQAESLDASRGSSALMDNQGPKQ
ncbi:MAG: hypothetical protein JNM89_11875 [Hyphomicrobiaceae bacterium]|nr:hypothetical protein [Hyphomicrobiaceae bacterium]